MLDERLKEIVMDLDEIPNAPFSIALRSKYVRGFIEKAGLKVEETPYYITGKSKEFSNKKKIVFISHLDHPGFVFKDNKKGVAFGTLYLDKLKNLKPIRVYSPKGSYLGLAKLVKVYGRNKNRILIEADFHIPKNSQGFWDLQRVVFKNEKIYARSHDNDIVTAVLLSQIRNLKRKDYDILFLFTKHEEVLQHSSFNIACNNSLNVSSTDIIINLESMKVYSTTGNSIYSNLNYESGLVLNISEKTSIYSQNDNGKRNLAESLINNVCENLNFQIQRGLAGGTTDARTFGKLGLTSNIVTLNVPNKYKHNFDGNKVALEEVYISDVQDLSQIIQMIVGKEPLSVKENPKDISSKVVREFPEYKDDLAEFYLKINERLNLSYRDVVKRGYYYPERIKDYVADIFWGLLSYIKFFFSKYKHNPKISLSKE
jgi:hypothetical protein